MNNDEMRIKLAEQDAQLLRYKSEFKDAVNELCVKCGEYKTQHLGSCDGCRWKERRNGDIG